MRRRGLGLVGMGLSGSGWSIRGRGRKGRWEKGMGWNRFLGVGIVGRRGRKLRSRGCLFCGGSIRMGYI